jgi:hypothetical protein
MENISTNAKIAIEQLLSVHALACMARASNNPEYFKGAYDWLSRIEETIKIMREELRKPPEKSPLIKAADLLMDISYQIKSGKQIDTPMATFEQLAISLRDADKNNFRRF